MQDSPDRAAPGQPALRLQPDLVEVPVEDPFREDLLGRAEFGQALAATCAALEGPCVLALNGQWGTGKTTFLRMFVQHLRNDSFTVVEINAWQTDYADNPLAAVSSAVAQTLTGARRQKLTTAAKKLLRVVAPPLLRVATYGVLNYDAAVEQAAGDGLTRWADASLQRFEEHQKSLGTFRRTLAQLAEDSGPRPLVVVVDELDRCRPTYAVEFLETIKHVFGVDGILFVLAVNRHQLDQSAAVLYGNTVDPESYFRRFFDIELTLPEADRRGLLRALLNQFGLAADDSPAQLLVEFLAASPYGIRSLQHTVQHYAIVLAALRRYEKGAWWWILPSLMVMKLADERAYRALVSGATPDAEIADGFLTLEWTKRMRGSRYANLFEAAIILAAYGRTESTLLDRYQGASGQNSVAWWVKHISAGHHSTRMLDTVSSRVEMLDTR